MEPPLGLLRNSGCAWRSSPPAATAPAVGLFGYFGNRDYLSPGRLKPMPLAAASRENASASGAGDRCTPHFLSGEVLAEAFRLPRILESPQILQVLSVATIALELFVGFGLWSRRWRRGAFAAGFLFHALLLVLIGFYGGLLVFGVITLAPYLLFLGDEENSRRVVWDSRGAFPPTLVAWMRRLDWLEVLRFESCHLAANNSLELHEGSQVLRGFDALREMLAVLPLSFLWAPLLRLPGVRRLGEIAYGAIARVRGSGR
jgi:hypothetical protein